MTRSVPDSGRRHGLLRTVLTIILLVVVTFLWCGCSSTEPRDPLEPENPGEPQEPVEPDNLPPVVTLIFPQPNSSFLYSDTIEIRAEVADPDGTELDVLLRVDNVSIGYELHRRRILLSTRTPTAAMWDMVTVGGSRVHPTVRAPSAHPGGVVRS